MSLIDALLDLFRRDEAQEELDDDPNAFLARHGVGDLTSQDILDALPGVCAQLPDEQAAAVRAAYGVGSSSGGPSSSGGSSSSGGGSGGGPDIDYPPPPPPGSDAVAHLVHYTSVVNFTRQHFEDNDTNIFQDNDTTVDNSVDQNILAFGDVNQTFDQDTAIGDRSIADGGEGSVNNTGDGAVQNTGIIADSTIATGDVGGSVTGDVTDSVVGDGNQVIDDSLVGAAAFGEGDAINAENVNQGDGNLTDIDNSLVNESAIGGSNLTSNDTSVVAGDDSNVAFGEGSSIDTQDTTVANFGGTVQVAGDESTQLGQTDNSVDDSYNTTDNSVDYQDNDLLDVDDNDAVDIDDQDAVDIDASASTPEPGA